MNKGILWACTVMLLLVTAGCGATPATTPHPTAAPTLSAAEPAPTAAPEPAPPEGETSTPYPPQPSPEAPAAPPASPLPPLELTSSAFAYGEAIPQRYGCEGEDISPPLQWSDPPPATESFALVSEDPDAPGGSWIHWVLYNLPPESRALPEAVPPDAELPGGSGQQGVNSWDTLGYGGPCPPSGTHRYFFRLYALDVALDLPPGATWENLQQAMEGHILEQSEWMGTYSR